jgi:hypothetical protein
MSSRVNSFYKGHPACGRRWLQLSGARIMVTHNSGNPDAESVTEDNVLANDPAA